jgi:predicted enzyme related to lactoylglutathione lyase
MGKRSSYEPGTFSWVDLATTDPEAAKAFYGGLFGWEAEDMPIPDGGVYSMMKLGDETVAAISAQQQQQRDAGIPPYWFNYVTVAGADAAAEAVKQAGGSVHLEPFDVMTAGRMAVVADPTGAMLGLWEPRDHIGATLVNVPGGLAWNELATNDVPAAQAFYEQVFGWKVEPMDTGGGPPYWMIGHEGGGSGRNGGIRELAPEQAEAGIPPHWLPYFGVASTDGAVETATASGGQVMFGPVDLPAGRIAVFADPQGAAFAVFQGEFDD